jgi:hypothetical protein
MARNAFARAKDALRSAAPTASLCDPILSVIPVSGAALSVLAGPASQTTVCASDDVASRLDELQFDLGEGPCWSAMHMGSPVLRPDFHATKSDWPTFANAVVTDSQTGKVGAMFAFPLAIGSLDIGALDLYSYTPAELAPLHVAEASTLAEIAAWKVLKRILDDGEGPYDGNSLGYSRREVHQATGMIIVQLDINAEDAELLLRAHAFSQGRTVAEIANDVVERRLDFSSHGPSGAE